MGRQYVKPVLILAVRKSVPQQRVPRAQISAEHKPIPAASTSGATPLGHAIQGT